MPDHMLGSNASAAAQAKHGAPVNMVELLSKPAGGAIVPIRLVTGFYPVTWAGYTWNASGQLLEIEPITESVASAINQVARLKISAVPASLRALALDAQYAYPGRPITLYQAWLNPSTYAVLDAPDVIYAGVVDRMQIRLKAGATDGTCEVAITCATKYARLKLAQERRMSDEQQRALYPGDTSLRFLAKMREDNTAVFGQR